MVKGSTSDEMIFDKRPDRCENVSYVYIGRKNFQAKGILVQRLQGRNMP